MDQQPGTILICPLNWGLGHATRDIPIIRRCMARGLRVIVASEAPILQLIQQEFPGIETDYLPGARITYSPRKNQLFKLLRQLPAAIYWLWREKRMTAKLVKKYKPQHIISDNRYGVRHPTVNSILITHQLMLKMPAGLQPLEKIFHLLVKWLISRFSACWIPDNPKDTSLAGDLVHKYPLPPNSLLIGPLSRFMDLPENSSHFEDFISPRDEKLLVMLSGPEPQRTILEELLNKKIEQESVPSILVAGKPDRHNLEVYASEWISLYNHLDTQALYRLIQKSRFIISRSGYTSIMDLWVTGKKAILIPTPGQTEQEYLARFHHLKTHFALSQDELQTVTFNNLQQALSQIESIQPPTTYHPEPLNRAIQSL